MNIGTISVQSWDSNRSVVKLWPHCCYGMSTTVHFLSSVENVLRGKLCVHVCVCIMCVHFYLLPLLCISLQKPTLFWSEVAFFSMQMKTFYGLHSCAIDNHCFFLLFCDFFFLPLIFINSFYFLTPFMGKVHALIRYASWMWMLGWN